MKFESRKYIFDSHLFDALVAKHLTMNELEDAKKNGATFYITHVQIDEINRCTDEDKRAILNLLMVKIAPKVIPTETFVMGRSRLGEAKLGTSGVYEKIYNGNKAHIEDALIGEVAVKNDMILVTEDTGLKKKVAALKGRTISINEFRKEVA